MLPIGILFALLSAVLFGGSTPFAKLLLGTVDPWLLAGLLYLGGGLGLGIVHVSRGLLRLPTIETPLRRSDVPWLAAVVASGGIAGPLLLMFGLARTEAAAASLLLILKVSPRWALPGWCFEKTSISDCCSVPSPFS